MAQKKVSPITIEGARIGFRNFSGIANQWNDEGNRNFCVFLEKEKADMFAADGWNVRASTPRDEDDQVRFYLPVKVAFSNYPPKIILIDGDKQTQLTEASVNMLDWADISNVDLIINPYNWEMKKKGGGVDTGIAAYLKIMYVTLSEDVFAKKYAPK